MSYPSTFGKYLEIQGVRIEPKEIFLNNPFEKKKYDVRVVITNTGKRAATLRILEPSSSSILMKPLKSTKIFPGTKISRSIKYNVSMTTLVEFCVIPIYINKELLNYRVTIRLDFVDIQVEPPYIDFGVIDAGPSSTTRTIRLMNKGDKPERFSIDLGVNSLNLHVEPIKGIVMDNSSKEIRIELTMFKEGTYHSEMWVICAQLVRVEISVQVVLGKIEIIYQTRPSNFTFLHFKKTYFGTKQIKAVLLKSNSQNSSIFCMTGEVDSLQTAVDKRLSDLPADFKHFDAYPLGGHLNGNDVRPLIFTFAPKKIRNNGPKYMMAVVNIKKLYCQYIEPSEEFFKTAAIPSQSFLEAGSVVSIVSRASGSMVQELVEGEVLEDDGEDFTPPEQFYESSVRIMMYGETEEPSVSIVPNELEFEDVRVKEGITRTLTISNNSYDLPIIFRYVKVTNISINPSMGTLRPRQKLEVEVVFYTSAISQEKYSINFDLLFWDRPRLTKDLIQVGASKIPCTIKSYNMESLKPKELNVNTCQFKQPIKLPLILKTLNENVTVAIGDLNSIMRPWNDLKTVVTPYAAIPRIKNPTDSYQLTPAELQRKLFNDRYFLDYLRDMQSHHEGLECSEEEACDLTCINLKTVHKVSIKPANFLPLTPIQLNHITITPRNTVIDWVSCKSNFVNKLRIHNDNDEAFRIYLRPQRPESVNFHVGNRFVIPGKSVKSIEYTCLTRNVGIAYWILDVVVNETHLFETTIVAHVKRASLELTLTDATFRDEDPDEKYLELSNPMNVKMDFSWEYTGELQIYPMEGYVPPGKSVTCRISYEIGPYKATMYDLSLCCDRTRYKSLKVFLDPPKVSFEYSEAISFGSVGVNLDYEITLRVKNRTQKKISFEVLPVELAGLKVLPTKGQFEPKGVIFFKFGLNRSILGGFHCVALINVARGLKSLKIDVEGTVEFPAIEVVPTNVKFNKMAASSFDIKCLTLRNPSTVKAKIAFDVSKTAEIFYSEYSNSPYLKAEDFFHIQPKTSKLITLHFFPEYAQNNSLFFPIIINDCRNDSEVKYMARRSKLQINVFPHKLITKTWTYRFLFTPNYPSTCVLSHQIKFASNKAPITFLIRTDEIKDTFDFRHVEGASVTVQGQTIICKLNEDEEVVFEATFTPNNLTVHKVKLPVFIREDIQEGVHNFIKLKVECPQATVHFDSDVVYLGFFPLEFPIMRILRGRARGHGPDCDMTVFCSDFNVSADIQLVESGAGTVVSVRIVYFSSEPHILNAELQLGCNCGCKKELRLVGGASNVLLTTYASVKYFRLLGSDWKNFFHQNSSFVAKNLSLLSVHTLESISLTDLKDYNYPNTLPYFPPEDHDLHAFMSDVLLAVEQWLFTQGNCGLVYYKIPDTIAELQVQASKVTVKNSKKQLHRVNAPIYELLVYLCGAQLNKYFSLQYDPDKSLAVWGVQFYTKILEMLSELGCCLPHVCAEFLLPFGLYKESGGLDYGSFYAASKQCWLDVVLQIYYVLVFNKTRNEFTTKTNVIRKKRMTFTSEEVIDRNLINPFVYNDHSGQLLTWLDLCLQSYKKRFMSQEFGNAFCPKLASKRIQNFDSDLSDGLALAAATLANCPYLSKYYKTLFAPPLTEEQLYHNACLNIKVWKVVSMVLYKEPGDLINMNPIRGLLLCDYLSAFLKTLRIMDTLTFQTNLSQTTFEVLTIINENNHRIRYQIFFFDNEENMFWTENSYIEVTPRNSYELKIYFQARFAKKTSATLALCGEIPGSKCTQSKIYTLEGIPQLQTPHTNIKVTAKIYEIKNVALQIAPPYEQTGTYEIYVADQTQNVEELNLKHYSYFVKRNVLSRLNLNQSNCRNTEEQPLLELKFTVCCISLLPKDVWLLFRNRDIGDFCVVVAIQATRTHEFIKFMCNLPPNFKSFACTCPTKPDWNNYRCPKNVALQIPFANDLMMKALIRYYTTKVHENVEFWEENRDTKIGMKVFEKILWNNRRFISPTMSYIYQTNVKYHVKSTNSDVIVQPNVIMDNLFDPNKTVEVRVHLNSQPTSLDLSLTSEDGAEHRLYKFKFKYKIAK